jgi:hypothetical protein
LQMITRYFSPEFYHAVSQKLSLLLNFTFGYFAYSYTMTIKYHTALSIFRAYYASVYVSTIISIQSPYFLEYARI